MDRDLVRNSLKGNLEGNAESRVLHGQEKHIMYQNSPHFLLNALLEW